MKPEARRALADFFADHVQGRRGVVIPDNEVGAQLAHLVRVAARWRQTRICSPSSTARLQRSWRNCRSGLKRYFSAAPRRKRTIWRTTRDAPAATKRWIVPGRQTVLKTTIV